MALGPSRNRAFVLRKVKDAALEDRPMPRDEDLLDDEVLVHPKATGICGSDVHYWQHGCLGEFVVKSPMILGHETAGVVVRCGRKVQHLQPGDKVALEPCEVCRRCEACKTGRYQLCPDMKFAATPPYDGTLTGYYRLPADMAYKLPDHLSWEDGALMEPLSVAVQAVARRGALQNNQTVAIFGAGPVGLLCMAVAKALGAKRIIGVDIAQTRLDFARRYAATDIFVPSAKQDGEDPMAYAERQAEEMRGELGLSCRGYDAVDLVVDATGAPPCIQTGILLAKEGGTYVQVGMGTSHVTVPVTAMLTKELKVLGSFRYGPGDYELSIALVERGSIDLKPLVSHRHKFEDAMKAYQAMIDGKGEDGKPPIKVMIGGVE